MRPSSFATSTSSHDKKKTGENEAQRTFGNLFHHARSHKSTGNATCRHRDAEQKMNITKEGLLDRPGNRKYAYGNQGRSRCQAHRDGEQGHKERNHDETSAHADVAAQKTGNDADERDLRAIRRRKPNGGKALLPTLRFRGTSFFSLRSPFLGAARAFRNIVIEE